MRPFPALSSISPLSVLSSLSSLLSASVSASILALAALVCVASGASAGPGCGSASAVQHVFEAADANGDGLLTRAEYEGAGLEAFGVSFAESDLDGDGATTLLEYETLYEMHHPPGAGAEI